MRVVLIGYGAVAAVHARQLKEVGATLAAICGPDAVKAGTFAAAHGFEKAETDLDAALARAEAAVVASPNSFHFDQAMRALSRRIPVLVEVPPCATPEEAQRMGSAAAEAGVALQCAHTARYAEPHRRIGEWIRAGLLGEIVQVNYFRNMVLNRRSWIDDALWHHATHPADLLLHWLGPLAPLACVASPAAGPVSEFSLLARLPGGGPATVAISYAGRPAGCRLTLVGSQQTVTTDGFSFLESGRKDWAWQGTPQTVYEQAIREQDRAFLEACRPGGPPSLAGRELRRGEYSSGASRGGIFGGKFGAIPWGETVRLVKFLAQARALAGRAAEGGR